MPVSVIMPAFNAAASSSRPSDRWSASGDTSTSTSLWSTMAPPTGPGRSSRPSPATFPEMRLLRNPRKGIAAARNTGLDHLHADCRS